MPTDLVEQRALGRRAPDATHELALTGRELLATDDTSLAGPQARVADDERHRCEDTVGGTVEVPRSPEAQARPARDSTVGPDPGPLLDDVLADFITDHSEYDVSSYEGLLREAQFREIRETFSLTLDAITSYLDEGIDEKGDDDDDALFAADIEPA